MIISGLTSKTKYLKSNKKKVVTVISTQVENLKAETLPSPVRTILNINHFLLNKYTYIYAVILTVI